MTIPRLNALMKYWAKHPPVHLIAAGMAGYKPPREEKEDGGSDFSELINFAHQMGGTVESGKYNGQC